MKKKDIVKVFEDVGAIKKGHFKLSSGLHSDTYVQCSLIFQYPELTEKLAFELAKPFIGKKIDVVVAPAIGGIILAFALAKVLRCRAIFTEREKGKMTFRRGFSIKKGERVLVAEDVITTGGSVNEVVKAIKKFEGEVVGVASLVDRGEEKVFSQKLTSLLKLKFFSYSPDKCPLCFEQVKVISPGSRYFKR